MGQAKLSSIVLCWVELSTIDSSVLDSTKSFLEHDICTATQQHRKIVNTQNRIYYSTLLTAAFLFYQHKNELKTDTSAKDQY